MYFKNLKYAFLASALFPWNIKKLFLKLWSGYTFGKGCYIDCGLQVSDAKLHFGRNVYINKNLLIDGCGIIHIGTNVRIGPACKLITSTHDITNVSASRASHESSHHPIVLGDGVWLCAGVMVLPSVTVAEGCVVAAGAVVTCDTAPNGLYGGVPARRIKDLP